MNVKLHILNIYVLEVYQWWMCPWVCHWVCPWMCPSPGNHPLRSEIRRCQSLTQWWYPAGKKTDSAHWWPVAKCHQLTRMLSELKQRVSASDVAVETEMPAPDDIVVVVVDYRVSPIPAAQTGRAAAAAAVANFHTVD